MSNIYETMHEDAVGGGVFWKPVAGKINRVRIITDPIRREADQKINRPQYQFVVTADDPKAPLIWSVSAKGALQQLVATMKANQLQTLISAVFQVVVTGDGMERKYTIMPMELPTAEKIAAISAEFPRAALEKALPKLFAPEIPAAPKQ